MEKRPPSRRGMLRKLASGFLLGGGSALWGIPRAFAERGGFAVGGEWLLILLAVIAPFLFSSDVWRR